MNTQNAASESPSSDLVPGPARGPGWLDNNQSLTIGVAFVLIAFYVIPVFLIAFGAWHTKGFQHDSFLFTWFAAFMKSADSTLNQFHKVLLPFMAAISVIAFRGPPTKAMLLLCAFILFSFVTTVFVDVVFEMNSTVAAIKGLDSPIDARLVKMFFVRIEESLMMYLMMLLGINMVNAKK